MRKIAAAIVMMFACAGAVSAEDPETPSPVVSSGSSPAGEGAGRSATKMAGSALPAKKKPVSGIIVGTPQHLSATATFFVTASTTFIIKSVGGVSGIAKTEYRIDNGSWINYEPFVVAAEGPHVVEYRSIDNAGNEESPRSLAIVVDQSPPTTTAFIGGKMIETGKPALIGKKSTITLESRDTGVGLAQVEYRVDQGAWQPYAPFNPPATGVHTISFRSVDLLGNVEAEKTVTVTSERIPLKTALVVGEPKHMANGRVIIEKNTPLTLLVEGMSGVAGTEYQIDAGQWQKYEPFTVAGEGDHRISFRSIDDSGAKETEKTFMVTVDETPPATTILLSDQQSEGKTNHVINGKLDVKLVAVDQLSAVKKSEYRVNGGPWTPYVPFGFDAEGTYEIQYRSIDALGNEESAGSLTATIDKTPPVSELVVSQPKKEENGLVYVNHATVFVPKAADKVSGVDKVEYRIDGWEDTLDTVPFSIMTPGKYRVDYQSYDVAGNREPLKTILVVVDPLFNGGGAAGDAVKELTGIKKREFSFTGKPAFAPAGSPVGVAGSLPADRLGSGEKNALGTAAGIASAREVTGAAYLDEYQPIPFNSELIYGAARQENRASMLEHITFGIVNILLVLGVMLL